MENCDDFETVASQSVGNQVACARHHQFARTGDSTRTAQTRQLRETLDSIEQCASGSIGGLNLTMQAQAASADTIVMLDRTAVLVLSIVTGVALELGVQALSGRREAWDAAQFFTIGLPVACLVSAAIGWLARGRHWIWTLVVAPSQVLTMMVRNGELGGLWPLTLVLSAVLSAPFVFAAFVGSRFRPQQMR